MPSPNVSPAKFWTSIAGIITTGGVLWGAFAVGADVVRNSGKVPTIEETLATAQQALQLQQQQLELMKEEAERQRTERVWERHEQERINRALIEKIAGGQAGGGGDGP